MVPVVPLSFLATNNILVNIMTAEKRVKFEKVRGFFTSSVSAQLCPGMLKQIAEYFFIHMLKDGLSGIGTQSSVRVQFEFFQVGSRRFHNT